MAAIADSTIDKVYNIDCIGGMKILHNSSIDLICDDPPQGITRNAWDKIVPFDLLWEQYMRVLKPDGKIIMFANQPFTSMAVMSNPAWFKYSLVWQKTQPVGFLNAKKMPLRSHEDILVFYKKSGTYNPIKTTGHVRKISTDIHKRMSKQSANYGAVKAATYDSTERYPKSVLTYKTDKQKCSLHPTQKPVSLIKDLILTYSNEGETVLDNFMGSGTTAIACIESNRRFIGFEKDIDSWHKIQQRIKQTIAL